MITPDIKSGALGTINSGVNLSVFGGDTVSGRPILAGPGFVGPVQMVEEEIAGLPDYTGRARRPHFEAGDNFVIITVEGFEQVIPVLS